MKVLVVLSRDPGGRRTGRKQVIETAVRSLLALGHEVAVVAVARSASEPAPWGDQVEFHCVEPPGLLAVAANVLCRVAVGRLSLNESLFYSRRLARTVSALAERVGADIVVADMLRTYELAAATGRPVVLDLDDLLSDRYREMNDAGDPSSVLGYMAEQLPAPARRPAAVLAGRALSVEARLIRRREKRAAREAAAVSLVASAEAERLSALAGRQVHWVPMAVPVADAGAGGAAGSSSSPNPVFVGGLDYGPNRSAISWYHREVRPHLEALGRGDLVLDVIGFCPDEVAAELACEQIRFRGYVDDLPGALADYRVAAIPLVSGTGVKTKVLEVMGAGLAVVSTPKGLQGIPVRPGQEACPAGTAEEFAAALVRMCGDPAEAAAMGERARGLVQEQFSWEISRHRWAEVLDEVAARPAGRLRVLFMNDYGMDQAMEAWQRREYPGHHLFGMSHAAANGLDVEILPYYRFHRLKRFSARRVGDLDQQLRVLTGRRRHYDVLYSGSQFDTLALAMLRRAGLYRKPVVATVHHIVRGQLARPWLFRLLFGGHDRLLCMSEDIRRQLVDELGVAAPKVEMVGWAVDLDFYQPAPVPGAGTPSFVLSAGKTKRDFATLARALGGSGVAAHIYCSAQSAPELPMDDPGVEIHFNDDRPDQSEALTMAELIEEYRRSFAVAIPLQSSETRGTTGLTSLLEALAMGRPVLMTHNSFMDIEDAGVGVSLPPGDVEGWRRIAQDLHRDRGRAAVMGQRARAVAEERFSLESYSARVAASLYAVCRRPVPAAVAERAGEADPS